MYLKAIRAYGFKSFADKLNIEFDKNITAIVGPNGSGKSNIVDAVKWVLGEQSVKSLRASDSMTDVIFSGSKTRDPLKRASVTLVFDNSDNYLQCEFNEVEIKRTVYNTGENEYYINNAKVRLKDITNLFLDTSANSDSFNIISQGSVQNIIDSKPEARRSIFENAAGVLKYKKRKEESLRKLDKTNTNIKTVSLLIDEINETIEPLEEQSKIAKEYLEIKGTLEHLEVSLAALDINDINNELEENRKTIASIEQEILALTSSNNNDATNLELLKTNLLKLDDEISKLSAERLQIADSLTEQLSQKKIMLERQKYEIDEKVVENNLVELKEKENNLNKNISVKQIDLDNCLTERDELKTKIDELDNDYLNKKVNKSNLNNDLSTLNKKIIETQNEITSLEYNINNDVKVPTSVKSVLNRHLDGVYDRIGNIYEVDDKYLNAIDIALGASSNFIVCEDETAAKKGIFYLKNANLGRATFFPLSVIKSRYLDIDTERILEKENGFVDIAANLIRCDKKFRNIIENQLGNVIVVNDIDSLNTIGKKINYRYRIVSLDGEILHSGGSITGGSSKSKDSINYDKQKLNNLLLQKKDYLDNYSKLEEEISSLEKDITSLEDNKIKYNQELVLLNEKFNTINNDLKNYNNMLSDLQNEISGLDAMSNNSLEKEIIKIVDLCNELENKQNILDKQIDDAKINRSNLSDEIAKEELKEKQGRAVINDKEKEKFALENNIGKLEIKLENNLALLSEKYNISYEVAKNEYVLDISPNQARKKLLECRKRIYAFGDVNTGAVKEYDRLKARYDFLTNQKEDLEKSCQSLLEMINEMDEIMKVKFKESFDKINEEFGVTFKTLFKGGKGYLKLTEPDDLLNTGVDVIAQPPGKNLNSIALLSGGEKTLTAIALLFAILNSKTVPFCIFDEVEAALDERNVDTFGEYLKSKKDKSQFILITHKKKTMEFADSLYGITMQESGVSKIVSVKLED